MWRDLSTTAVLTVAERRRRPSVSHGPKVIPPSETYDTARYGDRPFPVVPVQYTTAPTRPTTPASTLEGVINDPANEGSTFNLFQEMSLGQLFPEGTVPVGRYRHRRLRLRRPASTSRKPSRPGQHLHGRHLRGLPGRRDGHAALPRADHRRCLQPARRHRATTASDSNGSAVIGSLAGVGALQNIDSGCGHTGKLVYDAAAIADPEIDYSDYDTDKDGVVDFFMVVFAGCGGNGASQLGAGRVRLPGRALRQRLAAQLLAGVRLHRPGDRAARLHHRRPAQEPRGPAALVHRHQLHRHDHDDPGPTRSRSSSGSVPTTSTPRPRSTRRPSSPTSTATPSACPDFYSTGSRETYGDWNLMATDKSQNIDAFGRQELGWVVPRGARQQTAP